MQLPRNGGFAYGNNAVLRESQTVATAPRYFWLLNSDTVVLPGATQALIDVLVGDPTIGIAGSCLEDPEDERVPRADHPDAREMGGCSCARAQDGTL
jgi:N-acetylglucosaminyl-diphospho-decaprenol L-rhamnosyltransferase